MKLIKRQYEEGYHDQLLYQEAPDSQRNHARLAALLAEKQSGRLLEIGCGKGGFLRLAEKHFEVEGMDISRSAIEAIRSHFGERVNVVNVEQRPLQRHHYDAIVVFNILEHLRTPNRVIEKLSTALLPGGVLIGSVPNNQRIVGSLVTRIGNFFDRTHISTFSPDVWERMFRHAGFRRVDFFGEITLGRNRCRYLHHPAWPHMAFNLMFLCMKSGADEGAG